MVTDTAKRARMEAVIRSLMEKTIENGCTEAEAMQAALKAQELIERYQIEIGAEELKKEGVERQEFKPGGSYEMAFFTWGATSIGTFCDVKVYRQKIHNGSRYGTYTFFVVGLKSDLEFFRYLLKALSIHTLTGATLWAAAEGLKGGTLTRTKTDFIKACASRISLRLVELVRARRAAQTTGRALVPVDKQVMIRDWLSQQGIKLARGRSTSFRHGNASDAGAAHGDKANFGRPVGSSGGAVALIGRR